MKLTMKVFIVDDSSLIRERLAALIHELETVELVGQAEDAPDGLKAIRELRPDVVILDVRMPGGNGIQLLETLKQEAVAPVVIILTGFPYPQYRQRCLALGAEYFLNKTIEFEKLSDILKQLSAQAKAESGCSIAEPLS